MKVACNRVQRVPATENAGPHSHFGCKPSRFSPKPTKIDIKIEAKDLRDRQPSALPARAAQSVNTTYFRRGASRTFPAGLVVSPTGRKNRKSRIARRPCVFFARASTNRSRRKRPGPRSSRPERRGQIKTGDPLRKKSATYNFPQKPRKPITASA